MKEIKIIVKPGVDIPKEDNPRRYLQGGRTYTVPDTIYYRRRIGDGDAELVENKKEKVNGKS